MSIIFTTKKYPKNKTETGFTLFEIVFVMAIFAIMSSIIIFRFDNFGSQAGFDNLAQDVAVRILNAQKTAISGTLNGNFASGATAPIYGMAFSTDSTTAATSTNTVFTYFTDYLGSGPDGIYTTGGTCGSIGTSECLSNTTISTGQYVSGICATTTPTFSCSSGTLATDENNKKVNITFKRPFPAAILKVCTTSALSCSTVVDASKVLIELTSPLTGAKKTIVVKSLGQVIVLDGGIIAANTAS